MTNLLPILPSEVVRRGFGGSVVLVLFLDGVITRLLARRETPPLLLHEDDNRFPPLPLPSGRNKRTSPRPPLLSFYLKAKRCFPFLLHWR